MKILKKTCAKTLKRRLISTNILTVKSGVLLILQQFDHMHHDAGRGLLHGPVI